MKAKPVGNRTLMRLTLVMGIILLVALPALFYNLYKIQVIKGAELRTKAITQQTRDMVVSPRRGLIYDSRMTLLGMSATVETIVISPAEIKDDAEAGLIARGLSEILSMEYDTIYAKAQNKKSYYEIVARKVDKEISDKVRVFKTEHKLAGIKLFEDTKRYYPYSSLASTVIGFTNADNQGQYGVEYRYEDVLKGYAGRIITAKNNKGNAMPFYFEQYIPPADGRSLVLTVDAGAQAILEKHLDIAAEENACAGGARGIIMDVKTGAIIAMAQTNDYDLNNPRTVTDPSALEYINAAPTDEERQNRYLNALYTQWSNTLLQEAYEPGSVFKILTLAMALEENAVNLNTAFYCPGHTTVSGTRISCWKAVGHGSQQLAKALQNSCNVAFINIGQRIGHSAFYNYFKAFGFTEKTGVPLVGESTPIEGIHYHKYSVFSSPLYGGDVSLATYSFGQTFKITPLQLIAAVSSVVNGGYLMKPYIVSAYADSNGNITETFSPTVVRQVLSQETSKLMCTLLESVVSEGTGKNAYVSGYRVGGKTGTSEKRDKEVLLGGNYYIASFLGIAPCDDPKYAVLVILDEPTGALYQGGQIAAPVAGRIISDLLPYMNVKAVYTDDELAKLAIPMPNLVGSTKSQAQHLLQTAGLKNIRIVGTGEKVTSQYPIPGAAIPSSATVILYMGAEPDTTQIKVPNLIGKSYEDAMRIVESAGLYMQVAGAFNPNSGSDYVITRQLPGKDTYTTFGSVITVEFYTHNDVGE